MDRARKAARRIAHIDLTFVLLKIIFIVVFYVYVLKDVRDYNNERFKIAIGLGAIYTISVIIELWAISALRRATEKEQELSIAAKGVRNWILVTVVFGLLAILGSFLGHVMAAMLQILIRGPMIMVVASFNTDLLKILQSDSTKNGAGASKFVQQSP